MMKNYYNSPIVILEKVDSIDVIATSGNTSLQERNLKSGFGDIGSWDHPTNA